MKLELNRENLKEIVNVLKSTLSKGGIKPIFEHFLFEIKDNVLTIKSTDTKRATVYTCSSSCDDNFSFTIEGGTLVSLLSSLEDDVIVFDYDKNTNDVKLTCSKVS